VAFFLLLLGAKQGGTHSHPFLCYNENAQSSGSTRVVGSFSIPNGEGVRQVTVFEAVSLMIAFGTLIALLSNHKKK
jgi:hypothetical protein